MVETKRRAIDPASFFLIASLVVGILYCIFIPYGAGFDEERHLVRIYYMSQYHFLPNFPNPVIYEAVFDLSYQRRLVQTPAFDMLSSEKFGKRFSTLDQLRYGQRTQSIYSPVIFLPQALIGRLLWWKYDFPILPTILLQKIAGLLIFIAGGYFAIRVLPYGKWTMAALALMPSALYQAATLNADGFTAGVSFAFIGYVVAVYMNEHSEIQPRSVWVLVALSLLLGFAKPGAIILLPLLLILIRHPFPSKKWILILSAGVLLAILANVGWWSIASQGSTFLEEGEQSLSQQSNVILVDPFEFLNTMVQSIIVTLPDQIQGWTAVYGYWAGTVPGPVYFFAAPLILSAFLAEPRFVQIPTRTRIFLVGLFFICCLAIYGIAFAANYGTGVLALAKHGRYYIPFVPLFFLGFAGLFTVRENLQRWMPSVAMVSFLFVTVFYSFGIYTTYYTYCGYDAYLGAKCYLPVYKNLEKEGLPEVVLREGVVANQTFTNYCNGLESVGIYVSSIPKGSGNLQFSLLDTNQQVLASRGFSPDEIILGDYLILPVHPPHDSQGTQYEIQLQSVNLSPDEDFRVSYALQDYYPGQLSVNGKFEKGDLIIHYVCKGP